ncbi:Sgt2p [Rhizophagus irregularis DAOM 197198w]|uniref:Sgt2p n=2 Tax=Rhizophagus irregularis TaxID=588596 RepID=A0A015JW54_RHIIW|nr:Sgt2p [Rhizophagus irregularis DAOM 197198w]
MLENTLNSCILELEMSGLTTPNEKAEVLINKDLTKIENLFALKLLFENPLNEISPGILRNSLVTLANPTLFDYYDKLSVARLELHIRTWVAVLEKICFTPMRLSKELRDKVYNSLAKFAEIHKKTTQVMQEGIDNNYRSDFNQFNQLQDNKEDEGIINKRNYNIDFLLIHLRDTLHSLRDDETWFQEIIRRTKKLFKTLFSLALQEANSVSPNEIGSILTQLREGVSFKYPVASYYVDWRIMLIIQHNLFELSGSVSRKFQEMVLMEYFWSYLEKEWTIVTNSSILDLQSKFNEVSNKLVKVLRNTGNFINDLAGNEPLTLPHTLWFGILDLAQNLIQNSTRKSTHGLCYYLAIESLNRAPSSFIQFKAIEILFHLRKIDDQMFSIIKADFDQYIQKLDENNSEEVQKLLIFVDNKCSDDFNLLNNNQGKEKGKEKGKGNQSACFTNVQISKSDILGIIAIEMTCPIDREPTDQLCVLKCQHLLSFNNFRKLKHKNCPKCRENIEYNDIRYLPQNVIYNHLRSQFFEAGHILPLIKSEELSCDSDSGDSEVDNPILVKKKKILEAVKSNPNISFQSIFQIGNSKKQHPKYQNAMKELEEKNYKNAEHLCKEFLKPFPESYSMRCILAYTYLCLDDYEQAFLYLNQAIKLKEKRSITWSIRGEINFRQGNYYDAIRDLKSSIKYKTKINNIYIVLGINYCNINCDEYAIKNFKIALKKDSKNSLCLKYCAYIYEKQGKYSDTLMVLNKLLSVNKKDSLILCYYGEILSIMEKYDEAAIYFIKANNIDPENVHNLTKRAIAYYNLQEYDKASLDFNKVIQLDISNILAYYYKGLIYYRMGDIDSSITTFKKCIELDPNNDLEKMYLKESRDYLSQISTVDFNLKCLPNYHKLITKINQFTNIYHDKSLLIMRCKVYIELKKYKDAELDLNRLFELNNGISFVYLLKKYSNFWYYLCKGYCVNDFNDLIGFKEFINMYMFKEHYVYFASNLYNLKNYHQFHFQESNIISTSGLILSLEYNHLRLPRLYSRDIEFCSHHSTIPITPITYDIVWRINVKKINSPDAFINFMIESNTIFYKTKEYKLEYTDLLNLEGLGWIEYVTFFSINWPYSEWIQFSIETKKESIDMEIDYVRLIRSTVGNNHENRIYFPKMNHLLLDNVPEALEDKYFLRKETEHLLELKDIIGNL